MEIGPSNNRLCPEYLVFLFLMPFSSVNHSLSYQIFSDSVIWLKKMNITIYMPPLIPGLKTSMTSVI